MQIKERLKRMVKEYESTKKRTPPERKENVLERYNQQKKEQHESE